MYRKFNQVHVIGYGCYETVRNVVNIINHTHVMNNYTLSMRMTRYQIIN